MVVYPVLQTTALPVQVCQISRGHSLFFQGFEQGIGRSTQSLHLVGKLTLVFRRARFVLVGCLEFLPHLGEFLFRKRRELAHHIAAGILLRAVQTAGRHHGLHILALVSL